MADTKTKSDINLEHKGQAGGRHQNKPTDETSDGSDSSVKENLTEIKKPSFTRLFLFLKNSIKILDSPLYMMYNIIINKFKEVGEEQWQIKDKCFM